jgi:mannose-6-phosphate isomerase-like protein (cupin superfamily)
MSAVTTEASRGLYYASEPQLKDDGQKTWITRSANVVVVLSQVSAGTELVRSDNPDEYMLLLPPGVRADITAGSGSLSAEGETLTILPPGQSSIRVLDSGLVTRVFTVRAADLADKAENASVYANGAPGVAPLKDWPAPAGGFKLRNYTLAQYSDPKIFGRLFRSTNLMINVFERKTDRRDPRKMSPHSHPDFEQISLTLEGSFIHYLRTPWTADSTTWRDDEHVHVDSPSTLVIPANLIHTTRDVGEGVAWLIDIFGPPRMDFSLQPGVVRNADEYPMPAAA